MSQNFFSQMENTRKLLSGRLPEEQDNRHEIGTKTLNALTAFVYSCVWKDTEKTRLLIQNIHLRAVDAAKQMKVSEHTVRSARSQASRRLFYIFGSNVFEGIICGDKVICSRTMTIIRAMSDGYTQVENYIPDKIRRELDTIPEIDDMQFDTRQMQEEIKFIKDYSTISMMKDFQSLDKNKLRFIYGILRQDLFDPKEVRPIDERKLKLFRMIFKKN